MEREKSPMACPALDGSKLGFSEPLISSRGFCFAERRKQRLGMVGCCGVTAAWGGRFGRCKDSIVSIVVDRRYRPDAVREL